MKKERISIKNKEFENSQITLNWDYLEDGRGVRRSENIFQIVMGRLLFWVAIVLEVGILISEIVNGRGIERLVNPEGFTAAIFWIFFGIFLYTLFLLRNRETFLDKPRAYDLRVLEAKLKKGEKIEIELTNFLTHEILWIVDISYHNLTSPMLPEVLKKLLKVDSVQFVLSRLGLEESQIDFGLLPKNLSKNDRRKILRELIAESFIFAYENHLKLSDERVWFFIIIRKFFKESLKKWNILDSDFRGVELWFKNEALVKSYIDRWKGRVSIKPKNTVNRAYTSRYTPTLNAYARDFTNAVIQGDFVVSIARENELSEMVTLLEKGEKSAVLIVGEPGVGKTTLIKTLAVRMVVEDVPEKLQDMRLVGFDFNKAFSQSKNIELFKKKLRNVFDEVGEAKNVVLVLDNVNQLFNLRQEIAGEIANIIVDSFDAGNIRLIASTDRSQYQRFIRPHKALASLFSKVKMPAPSDEVATQIVMDEVKNIEEDYDVKIAYPAVKGSIELSHKFSYDRVLPDKAIDLLKETVVHFKDLSGKRAIEYDEVAEVVSSKVGVKLGSISDTEGDRLARLEEEMHKRIVDQNEAVNSVSGALRRLRSGLSDKGRPVATFLFFGPTGVGKTEVAKTVSEVYYGSEERMVRIDMSEYNEEENLKRLIGYTSSDGSFEGGFLTEAVYNNPFSLVLLDEIDKANPKVLDLFLQLLDEGYLVDGLGRKVDFSNTIIIATSNAGSSVIASLLEKNERYENVMGKAMEELKKVFRIEFLNRFDKIIMFKTLSREDVKKVAQKFVEQVRLKLSDKGITLRYGDELLERLAKLGYNQVFGAREMRRVVQEEVENKIAEKMVRGEVKAGGEVEV